MNRFFEKKSLENKEWLYELKSMVKKEKKQNTQ